ncbi:MAG: universal stress protein [Gammaproteobacteria bacterium]
MIKKILVPIDLSRPDVCEEAVSEAIKLADFHGASLHFVSVMPGFGMPVVGSFFTQEQTDQASREFARAFLKFLKDCDLDKHPHSIAVGKAWEGIVNTAKKVDADLIVMNHHARSRPGGTALIGSCTQQVAERSPCSVYLIKPRK